jgi:hypothetical protein
MPNGSRLEEQNRTEHFLIGACYLTDRRRAISLLFHAWWRPMGLQPYVRPETAGSARTGSFLALGRRGAAIEDSRRRGGGLLAAHPHRRTLSSTSPVANRHQSTPVGATPLQLHAAPRLRSHSRALATRPTTARSRAREWLQRIRLSFCSWVDSQHIWRRSPCSCRPASTAAARCRRCRPSGLRRTRGYRCCRRRRATGTPSLQVQGQGRAGEEGPYWLLAAWSAARTVLLLLLLRASILCCTCVQAAPPKPKPKVEDGIFGTSRYNLAL